MLKHSFTFLILSLNLFYAKKGTFLEKFFLKLFNILMVKKEEKKGFATG